MEHFRQIMRRLNENAIREDLRKLGTGVLLSGVIGTFVLDDKIPFFDGILIIIAGLIIWFLGVYGGTQDE